MSIFRLSNLLVNSQMMFICFLGSLQGTMFVVLGTEHMPVKRQPGLEKFINFSFTERQKKGEDNFFFLLLLQ